MSVIPPILAAHNLTKSLDSGSHRVEILRGIDLEIPAGQFVAIMGASGSGKSTLLGLLAGLDTATSGTIVLDGVDITGLSEDKLALVRGRKIGFVFQSYQLLPTLTAEENVLLPHELSGGDVSSGVARARSLLESVGLGDRLDHYPVQLSGGEQQRVALARAFMVKPPILMADEPTGNLDSVNGAHVLDLLISLNQREGTTMVLVTHDIALAGRADRIVTMRDGLIVADEIRTSGRMRLSLRTAGRIAWRETRSSLTKFLFVVFAVAIGVGALAGVRGFSESVRAMLNSESRTIMAADLSARQFSPPKPDQLAELDKLASRGVDRTQITETVSMAAATTPDATPALVSIKAVDPAKYPYYGTVKLSPDISLSEALTPETVVAGEDVLIRLGVKVGEHIRLGSADYRDGRDRSLRARPHVGQPQRRLAHDDFARRVRAHRAHAVGQPRSRALPVQDRAERPIDGGSPPGHSRCTARSPRDRLARVQSAHHPRSGSGHHVSQSHQPHRPDRRGDRRRHGHVRAPPAEDGQHRGHEIAGSDVGARSSASTPSRP